MDKLVDIRSFYRPEDFTAKLLFDESGGLTKEASAEEIDGFVKSITPRDGFFYLHINAMGAGEYYGSNRNGDYFPEAQLIKWHKTFETSPAHVFRHHVNKDPSIAIGKVIYAYYNPRMHRVELVAEVDKQKGAAEYNNIKNGMMPATSMACNTPFDVCSVCGNKAHTRQQYCEHLNSMLNQLLPDGRKVMSLNLAPLKFFDISIVLKPADVTSSVLQKVANHCGVVSSAEEALAAGICYGENIEKKASILKVAREKMAELIKKIDGEILRSSDQLNNVLDKVVDPADELLSVLDKFSVEQVLNAFAENSISPSMEFLAKYILKCVLKHTANVNEVAATAVQTLLSAGPGAIPLEISSGILPSVSEVEVNPMLSQLVAKYALDSSLKYDHVEKRAAVYAMPVVTHRSGYTNWQTGREEPTHLEQPAVIAGDTHPSMVKLLLTIAGTALLAKYMVNNLIEAKLRKADDNMTKSASITIKLLESSIERPFVNACLVRGKN